MSIDRNLLIIRQSSLDKATQLYIAGKITADKLETTAEYFVSKVYSKLGLLIGSVFTETQTQGAIVLQSSLNRAVELAVVGKIEANEVVDNMYLFADYVYKGVK